MKLGKKLLKRLKTKLGENSVIPDIFNDIVDDFLLVAVFFHCFFNLLDGVDDGGVVPSTKFLPDGGKGHLGDLPHDVNGHLTGQGDLGRPLFGADVLRAHRKGAGHLADDPLHRDGDGLVVV